MRWLPKPTLAEFTVVRVYCGTSWLWYEFAMVELTIKPYIDTDISNIMVYLKEESGSKG